MINEILAAILTDEKGVYVDVGAGDGGSKQDSLSYPFYKRGWRGLCIEPNTTSKNSGKKRRPDDTWVYGAAVGREHPGDTVEYLHEPTLRFAGVHPDLEAMIAHYEAIGRTVPPLKARVRQAIRLNRVIKRTVKKCDLLIVRVNGTERAVLGGFDFGLWKPRLVVIEQGDTSALTLTKAMGYYLLYSDPQHWVFSNDFADREEIEQVRAEQDEL